MTNGSKIICNRLPSTYQEPAEVLRWYGQTPQALDGVRALVLEEQIVDWLLERVRVTDKSSTFAEIMAPGKQRPEASFRSLPNE
jgi:trigger factor